MVRYIQGFCPTAWKCEFRFSGILPSQVAVSPWTGYLAVCLGGFTTRLASIAVLF